MADKVDWYFIPMCCLICITITMLFMRPVVDAAWRRGFEFGKGMGRVDQQMEDYRKTVAVMDATEKIKAER